MLSRESHHSRHRHCTKDLGCRSREAMACSTPVVTSNRGAVPEVVADAALMIDPTQPAELLEALQKVNDESTR
ncbi:MAG TPA: glycosyltransferase [Terriglobia bacterium]|nr:glycosyltransferase [Terriglobia bacterium]